MEEQGMMQFDCSDQSELRFDCEQAHLSEIVQSSAALHTRLWQLAPPNVKRKLLSAFKRCFKLREFEGVLSPPSAPMNERGVQALFNCATALDAPARKVVQTMGQPIEAVYWIVRGKLNLHIHQTPLQMEDGTRVHQNAAHDALVASLGSGCWLGDDRLRICSGQSRVPTSVCTAVAGPEGCLLVRFPKTEFQNCVGPGANASLSERLKFIKSAPLLSGLSKTAMKFVAENIYEQTVPARTLLASEGTAVHGAAFVHSGNVVEWVQSNDVTNLTTPVVPAEASSTTSPGHVLEVAGFCLHGPVFHRQSALAADEVSMMIISRASLACVLTELPMLQRVLQVDKTQHPGEQGWQLTHPPTSANLARPTPPTQPKAPSREQPLERPRHSRQLTANRLEHSKQNSDKPLRVPLLVLSKDRRRNEFQQHLKHLQQMSGQKERGVEAIGVQSARSHWTQEQQPCIPKFNPAGTGSATSRQNPLLEAGSGMQERAFQARQMLAALGKRSDPAVDNTPSKIVNSESSFDYDIERWLDSIRKLTTEEQQKTKRNDFPSVVSRTKANSALLGSRSTLFPDVVRASMRKPRKNVHQLKVNAMEQYPVSARTAAFGFIDMSPRHF